MAKQAKSVANRISNKISSPMIVDQYEYQTHSPIGYLRNFFKNRFILNQTESQFIDFKRKQFPIFAKDRYYSLNQAFKKKDRVELMRLLSIPLFDIFKQSIKDGDQLPFQLYDQIIDVKIVQARLYNKGNVVSNPYEAWHQLTLKFNFVDQENKDVVKHNVFERRECDSSEKDWRICYLE